MKSYRRLLILISSVSLCCQGALDAQEQQEQWQLKKSKHFIIHYQDAPNSYVNKMAREAEHYYRRITDSLGFKRLDFWTWQNRCKIYLYSSRSGYLADTQATAWSAGGVHVIRKEIVAFVEDLENDKGRFFDYTLPHEMGHIIFREAIGYDQHLPLWIDEGVAALQEKDRAKYLAVAKKLVEQKQYLPLANLSLVNGYEEISPFVLYSQAASMMDFLLNNYGRQRFVSFCRSLRDSEDWQGALLKTYNFSDLDALEKAWIKSLE